jgi:hypothetical protein
MIFHSSSRYNGGVLGMKVGLEVGRAGLDLGFLRPLEVS